ncbi:MAG: sugar-transfer associated ATP-grasp domain-containing protein [Kiloniellales bacterium]
MAEPLSVQVLKHPRKLLNFSRKIRIARKLYGESYPAMLRRFFYLCGRELYSPREIFLWDLLSPDLADDELDRAISKTACVGLQLRLNPESARGLTEDKSVFYGYCRERGLATPRLLAIIGSPLGWTAEGAFLRSDADWSAWLDALTVPDIVIKPSLGVYAYGVRLLSRQGDTWQESDGRRLSSAELLAELRADERYSSFVVQERVYGHPALAALSRTDYLQTLRLVTFVSDAAGPEVLFGLLRLIANGATTDNFQQGASGNLLADVCLETGRVKRVMVQRPCGIGMEEIARHPVSGAAFAGFEVPFWSEACQLSRQAAMAFLPLTSIGWDIAITPDGPVLMEGNAFWGPIHNLQRTMREFRRRTEKLLDGTTATTVR